MWAAIVVSQAILQRSDQISFSWLKEQRMERREGRTKNGNNLRVSASRILDEDILSPVSISDERCPVWTQFLWKRTAGARVQQLELD